MKGIPNKSNLDQLVKSAVSKKYIYGAVFYISSSDDSIDLISASGNMKEDSRYYIASINKFFISAIILRLHTEDKLDLQDKISRYLSKEVIKGLHTFNGKDHSKSLTIAHLMSLTSGLPCYLMDKQANGKIAMKELEAGIDQAWPVDRVIKEVKRMRTHFPPGKEGRAKYGDTNHQILSLILQNITGEPVNIVLNNLFRELNMTKTYIFDDTDNHKFVPFRYKSKVINIPLFLTSTQNDIISTARDQMTFIKAFFSGHFFPKNRLHELEKWNNIFFPFKYGIGIQKFHMPGILSPFHSVPNMVGHCGSTGSVAFRIPETDIYITGTTNQQARPNIAFQTIIKIIDKLNL